MLTTTTAEPTIDQELAEIVLEQPDKIDRLRVLEANIRTELPDIVAASEKIMRVGQWMLEAKEIVSHRSWTAWLELNYGEISVETARRWMRVAKNLQGSKLVGMELSKSVLYEISANGVPDDALEEIEGIVSGGGSISQSDAHSIIQQHIAGVREMGLYVQNGPYEKIKELCLTDIGVRTAYNIVKKGEVAPKVIQDILSRFGVTSPESVDALMEYVKAANKKGNDFDVYMGELAQIQQTGRINFEGDHARDPINLSTANATDILQSFHSFDKETNRQKWEVFKPERYVDTVCNIASAESTEDNKYRIVLEVDSATLKTIQRVIGTRQRLIVEEIRK